MGYLLLEALGYVIVFCGAIAFVALSDKRFHENLMHKLRLKCERRKR